MSLMYCNHCEKIKRQRAYLKDIHEMEMPSRLKGGNYVSDELWTQVLSRWGRKTDDLET